MRTHVVSEGGRGFVCNGEGPFACEECRGVRRCSLKHDVPWSAERVRERLLFLALGATISAGPWMMLAEAIR